MFDMFRGGKPDPITLMAVDYEESRTERIGELNQIVSFIKDHYQGSGCIDAEDLAAELGFEPLNYAEIKYVEEQLRRY